MNKNARILLLIALPALVAGAASIIGMLSLTDLPETVAAHWGPGGKVDRADSLESLVALVGFLVLFFTAGAVGITIGALREGTSSVFVRSIVGINTWVSVFLSVAMFLSVKLQQGVTDPFTVPSSTIGISFGVGFIVAVIVAVLAVLATPKLPHSTGLLGTEASVPLADGELVYWAKDVRSPKGLIALPVGLTVGIGVLFAVLGIPLWLIALVALIMVAAMTTLQWRVVVDQRGLTATGLFGFPRLHVPREDIVAAAVIDVSPLRDYGGWGIRPGSRGNWGVITRGGEAIEVQRRNGANVVVTVDDAATGAGLLTTLARRG